MSADPSPEESSDAAPAKSGVLLAFLWRFAVRAALLVACVGWLFYGIELRDWAGGVGWLAVWLSR